MEANNTAMQADRKYVLSIAGFDPSAGAGILADVKVMEQNNVYGFGVCSALTIQDDDTVYATQWMDTTEILEQVAPLIRKFAIDACKIGIIQSWSTLYSVVSNLKKYNPAMKIVVDPVLSASSGFVFHKSITIDDLNKTLKNIDLITPNYNELQQMQGVNAETLSAHCAVLLKGGHNPDVPGTDILYVGGQPTSIAAGKARVYPKHGSGCVLSAAIAAQLAQGKDLLQACTTAKTYTEHFLNSNTSLLGYHNHNSI